MNKKKIWSPPGWPWELELLALFFVIMAITIPLYLDSSEVADPTQLSLIAQAELAKKQEQGSDWDSKNFFWAVLVLGLYLAHIAMAGASIHFISTSFSHMFSPLLFSMLTYFRLYHYGDAPVLDVRLAGGGAGEIFFWILGTLTITFLIARLRMVSHLRKFHGVNWEITTRSPIDKTYFNLLAHLTPLIYPPREYRACPEGILIVGKLFIMPIPFGSVQSIAEVKGSRYLSSGRYIATSANSLLRVQLTESADPVYISPQDKGAFLQYCQQFTVKPPPERTGGGSRPGTSRGTQAGTAGSTSTPS